MIRHLLCTAALLFGSTVVRADTFTFSYSGSGVTASGTLTATSLGLGEYSVTGITNGSRDGKTITSVSGVFYYTNGSPSIFSNAALTLSVTGMLLDSMSYSALSGGSETAITNGLKTTTTTLTSFSINKSSVPEPSSLLILMTMCCGIWVMARKLPPKKT